MERNSFSISVKKHSIGSKGAITESSSSSSSSDQNKFKLKDTRSSGFGEDYVAGFSWPPRSYSCSFCKREFRSAQALGGHMNVHRRDRARLRQSPPSRDHGLNLNINYPSFSSSTSVSSPIFSSTLPSLLVSPSLSSLSSPCDHFPSSHEMKKWRMNGALIDPLSSSDITSKGAKSFYGVKEFKDYDQCNKLFNKTEHVRLDLDLESVWLVIPSKIWIWNFDWDTLNYLINLLQLFIN